jgi:hypothetical protein
MFSFQIPSLQHPYEKKKKKNEKEEKQKGGMHEERMPSNKRGHFGGITKLGRKETLVHMITNNNAYIT